MKRFISILSLAFVFFIGYAQEETYKFLNMFSISVSNDMELREDDDSYTKFLKDTLNYEANSEIVFQQKGLSKRMLPALSQYSRIMIMANQDESSPYPSSDDKSFTVGDLNELLSTAPKELGPNQRFVIQPTASIDTTKSGATYVKIHYTRTGTNGNVSVNICYFFNYDCAVKAVFSYRESEKDLWETKMSSSLNSFAWERPYTSYSYVEDDSATPIVPDNNSQEDLLKGLLIILLIGSVIGGITYAVRLYKKKNQNKSIEQNSAHIDDVIHQKKVVSETKPFNETKSIKNDKSPELCNKNLLVESNLNSLKSDVAKKVESQIIEFKKIFAEDPINFNSETAAELLKEEELPQEQKDRINVELKSLEEEYKKGVIPKQEKEHVKYNLEQLDRSTFYSFYTAPTKGTEIIPYRRRKIELRGYTETTFEGLLRNSLRNSTGYKVVGDISILTSDSSHAYEPDIAIVETTGNLGVRIDIEIDEPYGGYDKEPIHFIGCGDEFRDRYLANLGWLVVRFSEKQIFEEPDNCIYYLQKLLCRIDPGFKMTCQGKNPTKDKRWTEVEAKIMASQRSREKLLNHEFEKREKDDKVIVTPLTEMEKEVVNNAKPIYLPTTTPFNIDKTDKEFPQDKHLSFEPYEHIYLYDGRIQLTAVSNIIKQFFVPFDSIGLSANDAHKKGVPQSKILEEWDYKGAESREIGTFLHAQIESFFSGVPMSTRTHFSYNGEFIKVNKTVSIEKEIEYFKKFLKENSITPFRTEWHIFDLEMKIAGTIDLLCRNGDHFDIYDWKRSRKVSPDQRIWSNGIKGLDHIPDIPFYHYALQQNLYKYILEKNYGIVIKKMYIVVLHSDFNDYLKYEIPSMSREIEKIKSHIV